MIPKKYQDTFIKLNNSHSVYLHHPEGKNTIYYLHGGGFAYEMAPYYFDFFTRLAKACDAKIIIPIYPKTPKYHDAQIIEMIHNCYEKYCDENTLLVGDSAGGTLCYILSKLVKHQHIITISPWLDLCSENPDMINYQANDHFLTIELLQQLSKQFCKKYTISDSFINPMFEEKYNASTILMGTYDILYPDALKFQQKHKNVTLHTFEKAPHCFALLKEYTDAFNTLVNIIKKHAY